MSKSNYDKTWPGTEAIGYRDRVIDPKNRVSIPRAFANGDKRLIVTIHDNHLDVFSLDQWRKTKKQRLKTAGASETSAVKKWLANSMDMVVDTQRRVRLDRRFLPFIKDDNSLQVIVVGLEDHVEIWSPTKWQKFLETSS